MDIGTNLNSTSRGTCNDGPQGTRLAMSVHHHYKFLIREEKQTLDSRSGVEVAMMKFQGPPVRTSLPDSVTRYFTKGCTGFAINAVSTN